MEINAKLSLITSIAQSDAAGGNSKKFFQITTSIWNPYG